MRLSFCLTGVAILASSAIAQTVLDGTFGTASGWTSAMIQNTSVPLSSGTFAATVIPTGGMGGSGPFRETTMTYQLGGIQVAHIYGGYTYSATAGVSIAALSFSYDLIKFLPLGDTLSVAYAPLLLQNNTYYAALPYDGTVVANWQSASYATGPFSHPGLIASNFVKVGGVGLVNRLGDGPQNPDFSCAGAPIQFGYLTANSNPNNNFVTSQSGIDNFMVTGISGAKCSAPACNCCGTKPQFAASPSIGILGSAWTAFTGPVAVVTQHASLDGGPLSTPPGQVLVIWNLSGQSSAPLNVWWSPPATQYYSDARWNKTTLGDVFGLTLDSQGNIYIAATRIYSSSFSGSLASGPYPSGQIYKIANGTGTPTAFGQIPNNGEGLGNISYDCATDGFYASSFTGDASGAHGGLIYRMNSSGAIQSTWDHGLNLPSAVDLAGHGLGRSSCSGTDGSSSYAKLGCRPWAVHVNNNRLYYSIWNDDSGHNTGVQNEIWSIALDGTGGFVGPERLEIQMPRLLAGAFSSNPVSDISFSPEGTMMVAERTMTANNTSYAHQSRALEFSYDSSAGWLVSVNSFHVSSTPTQATGRSSAGGVDYDFSPGGRAWVSGDALHLAPGDYIYGIQGFPRTGGDISNSILIDADNYTQLGNKTQIGDVKIPCPDCTNPPVPVVISGPRTKRVSPATFSIAPQLGVEYKWSVVGGTQTAGGGSSIDVAWLPYGPGNTGPGSITVVVVSAGCGSVSTSLSLPPVASKISASVSSLNLTAARAAGSVSSASQATITLTSDPYLNFTAVASMSSGPKGWLTVTPGSGISGITDLTISAAGSESGGPYTGAITIVSADPTGPLVIPVTYTVLSAPMIASTPAAISFAAVASDEAPTPQTIALASTPSTGFTASASVMTGPKGWLTVTPVTGTTGITPIVVSASLLTAGNYSGTILLMPVGNAGASPTTVPVTFVVNPPTTAIILIQTNPSGLQFSIDGGVLQTAPQKLTLSLGSHALAVVPLQQTGTASGTQYTFTGWSDNGAASHSITVTASSDSYTAKFATQYQLKIAGSPAAAGTVTPVSGLFYDAGSSVPIAATAASGYTFVGWTGNVASPSTPSTSVTMGSAQTVVANFGAGPTSTVTITGVANAASGTAGIAPNTYVTVKGNNLAPSGISRIWQASDFLNNRLPTVLDGVSVTVNGIAAYIYFISPTQINVLTAPDSISSPAAVQVMVKQAVSNSFSAPAQSLSPSLFTFGQSDVAATHADGSLVGATTLYPGASTPAKPGETIILYGNGFGATAQPAISGSLTQSGTLSPLPVVQIGGFAATVQFAGLVTPGLYQLNVVVPTAAPDGDLAIRAAYGGFSTQTGALVTVRH
jgi:uncharacterized protein (TIGR03437 family)